MYTSVDADDVGGRVSISALVGIGRYMLLVEGLALLVALVLGGILAALTRGRLLDSFILMVFVVFLGLLGYGVLAGPGFFLARPRFAPLNPEGRQRWRRWLAVPTIGTDPEFSDLVLFTILGFLLLGIGTALNALARLLGA